MLLAVQLVCYPVAVGGSNFILLSLLFYFCFYLWSKWGKNSSSINSSSWAFDSHWMCRTTLHSIPSSNICENFSFSYFNNSVLTCIYVLLASSCQTSFSFHLRFVRPFTTGTFMGANHHCSFLTFSAGCFDIQHSRTCILVRMKNICFL